MVKQYSISAARNSLPSIIREVERGSAVELTRRGKRVAVLLSTREHEHLKPPEGNLWSAIQEFRATHDLAELDVAEAYADVRDRSTGRPVTL